MPQETLLIVEDNLILREGLRDILVFEGYKVLTAANGLEALERMQADIPDFILSDIAMPEMDGFAFFQEVRSHDEWLAIPFVFLTARGEKQDIQAAKNLGAEDYLVKPLSRAELLAAVRARLSRSQQIQNVQLQHAYEDSLKVLANAIDVRDPYTRGHVERVTDYAQVLADQLGLQGRQLDAIRFGAILHDVGKIDLRKDVLVKPASLTDTEWLEIRRHPVTGARMLVDIPYLAPAVPIVRHHHERWDGSGYPDHLRGSDIPLGARIVAVADSFDAMTTHRPYCPSRGLDQAFAEILNCAGSGYDPEVVAAFKECREQFYAIWNKWFGQKEEP